MDIAVLGPLAVDGGAVSLAPRDRVALVALTVRAGREVSVEEFAAALWADDPPASWAKVVPGCVMRLRRTLGHRTIETTPAGYRLVVDPESVDARRFERLVGRGNELLVVGEPDRAAHIFGEALALWRGKALVEVEDWAPGRIEATRLEGLRLDAEEAVLEARLQTGLQWEVLGEAQSRVAEAPLRERRWGLLAQAQYRTGRQSDALQTLHKARTVLVNELGLDPGPELVGLEQAILRQDPSLMDGAAYAEPSTTCPYLGLVPYDVDDADVYFGRDDEVASCLRSLAEISVLVVTGPSGSGKSSLVRAGLAAALGRNGRGVSIITPGAHPMDSLTDIDNPGPSTALVVDQCEEALLLCDDPAEQTRFLTTLADYADHGLLVVAFRADRLGDFSRFPDFAGIVERNLHLLSPMTESDLRTIIERPARQAGLLLEPGLVDLLLREVESEPGALPLLSHALRQTWLRREARTLTVAGYLATGGIRGAVAQSAEQVYMRIGLNQRDLMRDLLLRLVVPSPDGDPVRNRMPRRMVATDDDHERIIEQLVAARLVTSDDGFLVLAHEAVAHAWPRLQQWLEEDTEGRRILRHLPVAADTWESMGRPDSELYRGVRLTRALEWRDRAAPKLTASEQAFLDTSQAHAEDKLHEAVQRAEREARTGRRTRRLAIGLAGVLVLALLAAGLAMRYQHDAAARANEATAASTLADANRLAALSKSVGSLDLSLLLAAEATQMADTTATQDGLLSSLMEHRRATRVIQLGAQADDVELAANGRVMFVARHTGILAGPVESPDGLDQINNWDQPFDIAASSSRDMVATWAWTKQIDPKLSVFASDGTELLHLVGEEVGGWPQNLGFRPDGRRLLIMENNWHITRSLVREVDVTTGKTVRIFPTGLTWPSPVAANEWATGAVADDGSSAVTWLPREHSNARRVDLNTGSSVRIRVQNRPADTLGFVPLSTGVAQRWSDGAVTLYDKRGRFVQVLDVHQAEVNDVVVAPDGTWAASVDDLGAVVLWSIDPATGMWSQRESLVGHTGAVNGVAVDPSGTKLVTASRDGTAITWDVSPAAGFGDPVPVPDLRGRWIANTPATITPGKLVVAPTRPAPPGDADTLRNYPSTRTVFATFLNPSTGRVVDDVRIGNTVTSWIFGSSVSVSPDRSKVAVTDGYGATVLDTRTHEVLHRFRLPQLETGETEPMASSAWTPDGSRLLLGAGGEETNTRDGNLVVVDTDTWKMAGERIDIGGAAQTMELSPDQRLLAVGMDPGPVNNPPPGQVKLLDADTLKVQRTLTIGPGDQPFDVSFSPDGTKLATGGLQGEVAVFDVVSGDLLHTPDRTHNEVLTQVEWLPDNRTVVTTGMDGMVSLYDTQRGLTRVTMPGAADPAARYTWLTTVSATEITAKSGAEPERRYPLESDQWLAYACQVAGRNLTRDEWAGYLGNLPYQQTCPQWDQPR